MAGPDFPSSGYHHIFPRRRPVVPSCTMSSLVPLGSGQIPPSAIDSPTTSFPPLPRRGVLPCRGKTCVAFFFVVRNNEIPRATLSPLLLMMRKGGSGGAAGPRIRLRVGATRKPAWRGDCKYKQRARNGRACVLLKNGSLFVLLLHSTLDVGGYYRRTTTP